MLKNYLVTALRNLSRNRIFAMLNVFGLALGMSISLIFIAMLTFIYRYDDFHSDQERIYRVTTYVRDNQENPAYASTPMGTARALEEFSGVENVVRIHRSLQGNVLYREKQLPLTGYFADGDFLSIFNFPLIRGDHTTALEKQNSIVITERAAARIFGTRDPLGEIITMKPYGELVVTGVVQTIPKNSHLQFEAIASYTTLLAYQGPAFIDSDTRWTSFSNSYVYTRLSENTDPASIENYLNGIADAKYAKKDFKASFKLQRLDDIVPGPSLANPIGAEWEGYTVPLIIIIVLVALLPPCSNYVSLAISQSLRRMKEIGVRKVMGGQKRQIFTQFVLETTITVMFALALSYIFFEIIRSEALKMLADGDVLDLTPSPATFAVFILFALLVGFAAGIIPALFFARIAPVSAMKSKPLKKETRGGFSLKSVVITAQLILSLGFIMAVAVMLRQYHYTRNYDFGFDQKNILDVEIQRADPQLLMNELEKLSSIETMSRSSHVIGLGATSGYVHKTDETDSIEAFSMSVDENFIPNLKLDLLFGENFSSNANENSGRIIVNEELAKKLNAGNQFAVVGEQLALPGDRQARIAGIIRNFHYAGLRDSIGAFYFVYQPERFAYINVKLQSADINTELAKIKGACKTVSPHDIFSGRMLSDEITDAYQFYFFIIKLWSFLGVLAITVACLGMLGTIVFTIRNRLKEISIRKVMGASSESLVILLSKDFVVMMAIASIITVPSTYFMMSLLLETVQSYRVPIGPSEIVVSIVIMLLIGMSTILSQTMRAANTNPVDNLRAE
ncbi:MAG TPA: ABC transporter permease [Cyclobacteriaceae bacterium]|nr:ABC transporter permease [Cyclobacteriaceae bacterium]